MNQVEDLCGDDELRRMCEIFIPVEISSEWDFQRTMKEGWLSENDRVQWWTHAWGSITL